MLGEEIVKESDWIMPLERLAFVLQPDLIDQLLLNVFDEVALDLLFDDRKVRLWEIKGNSFNSAFKRSFSYKCLQPLILQIQSIVR